jgi:hypothetical protein
MSDRKRLDALVEAVGGDVYEYLLEALHPWRDYMAVEDVSVIASGLVEELNSIGVTATPYTEQETTK